MRGGVLELVYLISPAKNLPLLLMADRSDGPTRSRRKSLVDIGRAMGVIESSESLPRGFDLPISPSREELHLSPRSRDGSPRSSHSSVDNSSAGSSASLPEPLSRISGTSDSIPVTARARLDRISEDSSAELNDGPSLKLNGDPFSPPSEQGYGSRSSLDMDSISRSRQTVSTSHISSAVAVTSIPRGEHHRSPSEFPPANPRYAHLPSSSSYSSTTPNPRTSSSPLSGALSFFSKIFTPTQESATPTPSTSAPGRSTLKDGPRQAPTGISHSTPSSSSRLSDDFPRTSVDSQSSKLFTTRPPYVVLEPRCVLFSLSARLSDLPRFSVPCLPKVNRKRFVIENCICRWCRLLRRRKRS